MSLDRATPPVNVYEGHDQLSVVTPIPGAHPAHVDVLVEPMRVHLRAECKYPQESQHYHRRDWQVGAWEAEVALPRKVDPSRARASLNLGVLVIIAPTSDDGAGEHHPTVREGVRTASG